MTTLLYDDTFTLIDTLNFPQTTKVSTSYIKSCMPLLMTKPHLDWMVDFHDGQLVMTPALEAKIKKPSSWTRAWKGTNEKYDGCWDEYEPKCIVRVYTQHAYDEDNFRWEFISNPQDTQILAVILVSD